MKDVITAREPRANMDPIMNVPYVMGGKHRQETMLHHAPPCSILRDEYYRE